jgi:hypothetical protein
VLPPCTDGASTQRNEYDDDEDDEDYDWDDDNSMGRSTDSRLPANNGTTDWHQNHSEQRPIVLVRKLSLMPQHVWGLHRVALDFSNVAARIQDRSPRFTRLLRSTSHMMMNTSYIERFHRIHPNWSHWSHSEYGGSKKRDRSVCLCRNLRPTMMMTLTTISTKTDDGRQYHRSEHAFRFSRWSFVAFFAASVEICYWTRQDLNYSEYYLVL